jgi:trk system potassium uptake protein TrkH
MIPPLLVDFFSDNYDWYAFLTSVFYTAFVGLSLVLTNRGNKITDISVKDTFFLTGSSWVVLTFFSSLPFVFSTVNMTFTDAFFEAMSGITTTGATVMTDLDLAPPGVLVWRAMLQWIGGIGIIVVALAILPMLNIGGMQLFRTESSDRSDKVLPRARQLASALAIIYLTLTTLCAYLLYINGMTVFDAILHSLTTVSTGGFSTHDQSIAFFDSVRIETVFTVFAIICSIPFTIYIRLFYHGNFSAIFKDSQIRWFLMTLLLATMAVTLWLYNTQNMAFAQAFRFSSFSVISVITTSGFAITDYSLWGSFAVVVIFLISVIGGCTGSTAGGIKIFRFQILYGTAKHQLSRLLQPHGVFKVQYNQKPVDDSVETSVMSFFILFAFCFVITTVLLSATGLDYITSMSASASALANVGPGLGNVIGPVGNYQPLTDSAKWILSAAMLVGRLELFTILVLFTSYFWRD